MNSAVVLILAVAVAITQGAFCPGERKNGKRCLAKDKTYKCGVFLEDLVPRKPITWLGALPDALKKVKENDYQEILGEDITPDSFKNFICDPVAANARCYTTLTKFKSEPLDSCDKNLVNTKSGETVGDYLCGQVRRWLKNDEDFKANGKDNIKIPFYYSQCGEDWTPVTDGETGALYTDEELCCSPDGLFRRCDGSDYTKECPEKK
eukprot:GFUD01001591.1.p1 GENE.GFUD01001591.1~~GFUD01001591.1.p1  ORF type:complete len:207 (+),score=69.50 GFUD01001591.1:60-680(+)